MRRRIERIDVHALDVPVEGGVESDGTHAWRSTGMVAVELRSEGVTGLGWTYTHPSAAGLVRDVLAEVVLGRDPLEVGGVARDLLGAVRNVGSEGMAAAAISAVDHALWDLKARLLELPLARLLGVVRPRVEVYGSGGFTSLDVDALQAQLSGWVAVGIRHVKMKVGRAPADDVARVAAARLAIGPDTSLYVDANGAWDRVQALAFAEAFAEHGVSWIEEPVSSDDVSGLRLIRERLPPGVRLAAGEYGWGPPHFLRLLEAGAVDVLMPDSTRCLGASGWLAASVLADAHGVAVSSHCAPALHLHLACASPRVLHLEYFADHVRIERMLLDGVPPLVDGALEPDWRRHGHGCSLRHHEAARFAA